MWAACLFCHGHLGRNALLPTFPVGRRLAFDPVRGRLWVLCPRCARWNLSPLEERWEAIEDAERRAMEGGLAELEAAWREAEEITAIADNLLKRRAPGLGAPSPLPA